MRKTPAKKQPPRHKTVLLKLSPAELDLLTRAARSEGRKRADWIRWTAIAKACDLLGELPPQ